MITLNLLAEVDEGRLLFTGRDETGPIDVSVTQECYRLLLQLGLTTWTPGERRAFAVEELASLAAHQKPVVVRGMRQVNLN